ncbi:MAG: DnaA/Hda family protein [candidate division WOR-3 bacterium]
MIKKSFSFENFYVYEGNRVALMAARKIVEFPGEIFNPFYLYALGSYGKTYLLWTIYTELSKKEPALIFTPKEFEDYLQKNTQFDSAIFVDDVNRVSEKYQDAILAMIDVLIAKNKQVCFSGNAPPRELKNLGPKIASRLEGGLVCDLQAPREIALVEFIKRKSEERGIIVPDEIALELTQLSGGSFRTIDGMLNRLVAYASLGNITFDLNTIRLILKEFYPRGIYSPVSSLVEELKKSADEVLTQITEIKDPRTEYKEKIYIWEMKGFDTSELKPLLDGDIEKLTEAYNSFIKKVERLIELQKEFGALDISQFPEEALKIESMLFSPNKVEEIERLLNTVKEKLQAPIKGRFEGYIISACNQNVIELYEKSILPALGKEFNPYIIFGNYKTGKTFLAQKIAEDLKLRGLNPLIVDFAEDGERFSEVEGKFDVLLIDNFHKIFNLNSELRTQIAGKILDLIKKEKGIFIFSEPLEGAVLNDDEKLIFECGVEVSLKEPDLQMVDNYLKSKLAPEEYEAIKNESLPQFENFAEIDTYIADFKARSLPGEEKTTEEGLVMLGLPGEEELEKAEEVKEIEPALEITHAIEPGIEPSAPRVEMPLKKFKEERLIIQEIPDELIEENYVTSQKER